MHRNRPHDELGVEKKLESLRDLSAILATMDPANGFNDAMVEFFVGRPRAARAVGAAILMAADGDVDGAIEALEHAVDLLHLEGDDDV